LEELKKTIALLFKRKGRPMLTEKEFVFSASMDLRWFPPKEAQKLLQAGINSQLLIVENGKVRPNFDVSQVEVPLDFVPTEEMLKVEPKKEDLFLRILERISKEAGKERKVLISRINEIQERMELEIEVAALLAGKELGVDLSDFYDIVEKEIFLRSRER